MPRRDDELFRAAMADTKPLRGRRKVTAGPPSVRALLRERPVQRAPDPEPAQPTKPTDDPAPGDDDGGRR